MSFSAKQSAIDKEVIGLCHDFIWEQLKGFMKYNYKD